VFDPDVFPSFDYLMDLPEEDYSRWADARRHEAEAALQYARDDNLTVFQSTESDGQVATEDQHAPILVERLERARAEIRGVMLNEAVELQEQARHSQSHPVTSRRPERWSFLHDPIADGLHVVFGMGRALEILNRYLADDFPILFQEANPVEERSSIE
jgi:hypothetical protein